MFSRQWSPESKRESSLMMYYAVRVATPIWLVLWAAWVCASVRELWNKGFEAQLLLKFPVSFVIMTTMVLKAFHLGYKYVAHVRITHEGLAVRKGSETRVQPWHTIAEISIVRFVQPGCWKITFNDGSHSVAFLTGGTSTTVLGQVVKAKSALVDEIKRRVSEAGQGDLLDRT